MQHGGDRMYGGGTNVTEMGGGPITTPKHPDKQIYP